VGPWPRSSRRVLPVLVLATHVLGLAALGATACGGDGGIDDDEAAAVTGTVTYTRSGGIAGVSERVEVALPEGAVTAEPDPRFGDGDGPFHFTLGPDEVLELQRALVAADLEGLRPSYGGGGADFFIDTVTYAGRTVSAGQGSGPDALQELLSLLGGLLGGPPGGAGG